MNWKDIILMTEMAIKKYKDNPDFVEEVKIMQENLKRMKLQSPVKLATDVSKKEEKEIIRQFKKLGIEYIPISPSEEEMRKKMVKEMNKIANEIFRGK